MPTNKLAWYLRRLSRMGPAEIAHRVREQARRWADRRRRFCWEAFDGFDGPVSGLPGLALEEADDALVAAARQARARIEAGRLGWLGLAWPPVGEDWQGSLWTLDPVSGERWSGSSHRHVPGRGDVKYVWEPNRLQFLQPLALLAARGDREAAALAWSVLDRWMAANPPYDGVNWTSGIEAASRIVSVLVLVAGAGAPADAATSAGLKRFLQAHARMLARYPSLHSSSNNHLVAELGGLFLARLAAPGLAPVTAAARTLADLEREVLRQFHPDGVGAEQSPTYAAYSMEWFVLAGAAAEASGLPVSVAYRERIGRAAEHLFWLMDEAGRPPRIGDDDEGRVLAIGLDPETRYPASVAAMAARWAGRPLPGGTQGDPNLRDLVHPLPADAQSAPPLEGERVFAEGGHTVVRRASPRGPVVLVVDHGPLGFLSIAAHSHADALSLTLSWGEEPVLVDAGAYLYQSGGAWRDRFRGTAAHNTLRIEDADQSRIIGPFAWADHAATRVTTRGPGGLTAVCEGWRGRFGVAHERRVDWSTGTVIHVEDHLAGIAPRPLGWATGLSLAPGCRLRLDGTLAEVETPAGRRLAIRSALAPWRREASFHSPRFGHKVGIERLELAGTLPQGGSGLTAAFTIEMKP